MAMILREKKVESTKLILRWVLRSMYLYPEALTDQGYMENPPIRKYFKSILNYRPFS